MKHFETAIQSQFIGIMRKYHPDVLLTGGFAGESLGAGIQAIVRGKRRKAMGYRPGSPDVMILEPRGKFHGLFLEFKDSKGTQSPDQKIFESASLARGYLYEVVRNIQAAIDFTETYLKISAQAK